MISKINAYLIENNITTIKLYRTQTLSNSDIKIQTTNKEEPTRLKRENSLIKMLKNKVKIVQK